MVDMVEAMVMGDLIVEVTASKNIYYLIFLGPYNCLVHLCIVLDFHMVGDCILMDVSYDTDYHRKRHRDDDRHGHETSKRISDHESRRSSDHDSRPVNS